MVDYIKSLFESLNEVDTIALGGQVNPRIESIASAHEFMDDNWLAFGDNQSTAGKKRTNELLKMMDETDWPYIQQHDNPIRANYVRSENYPLEPDTLNVQRGDESDVLAELAHGYQYAFQSDAVRDSLGSSCDFQKALYGEETYGARDFLMDENDRFSGFEYYYPSIGRFADTGESFQKITSYDTHPGSEYVLDSDNLEESLMLVKKAPWRKAGDPLTTEFEAHSILEPWLYDRFHDGGGDRAKYHEILSGDIHDH